MSYGAMGLLVVLAVFAAVTILASLGLALAWPAFAWAAGRAPAAARARLLLALRALPAVVGATVAVALASRAWADFEPRQSAETPGPLLGALAAAGLLLVLAAVRRTFVS